VLPDEYRRRAAECLRAKSVADSRYRASLAAMAQSWLLLARQAEKNLTTEIVYETPEPQRLVRQQQQQQHEKK